MLADALPTNSCPVPRNRDLLDYPHLKGVQVIELTKQKRVSLIMGTDEPSAHVPSEVRRGSRFEPQALQTPFGWTVVSTGSSKGQCAYIQKGDEEIHRLLQKLYNHDFQDAHIEKTAPSRHDLQAVKVCEDSIKLVNGQYQLDLPWKEGHRSRVQLPDSSSMALSRAKRFGVKMKRESKTFKMDQNAIKEYKSEGFSRRLSPSELIPRERIPCWFLPLHSVTDPYKPVKVRVTFDAKATTKGTSLNDHLLTGPDLANSLLGVPLRFRKERITIQGDIKGMFNAVKVIPENTNAFCFYVWEDCDLNKPLIPHQMCTQVFGAESSPGASYFALKQTAKDNAGQFSTECVRTLERDFYVDDLLNSVPQSQSAVNLLRELCSILEKGGFHLHKITTNCPYVQAVACSMERAKKDTPNNSNPTIERALGVKWDSETDQFIFMLAHLNKIEPPTTRRECLSLL
jgi:hypothetical protein